MIDTPLLSGDAEAGPRVDLDTHIVMDHAVVALADRRSVTLDPPTQCHLLASLIAQADTWLSEQVAAARGGGASWGQVGRLVGVTATAARQRWSAPARTTPRQTTPPFPSKTRP